MGSKYGFEGAQIGTLTIIEEQFGTVNIGVSEMLKPDEVPNVRAKLQAIRADLIEHHSSEPGYDDALAEVDKALAALDQPAPKPATITSNLKSAAEAMAQAEKATGSAKAIVETLAAAAKWIATLVI